MIRLLSYIYPITKKVISKYNGTLEITWYNGKKLLNTKNANYSYGSLEQILKFGVSKINLNNCENSLILGLGGGSIIGTLRNDFKYKNDITAIEIDPIIVKVAQEEFQIQNTHKLNIVCIDALKFLKTNKQVYDFIIIDLFIDNKVPKQFLEPSFWELIIAKKPKYILFNASLDLNNEPKLEQIINQLQNQNFKLHIFNKVEGTNTLLVAKFNSYI